MMMLHISHHKEGRHMKRLLIATAAALALLCPLPAAEVVTLDQALECAKVNNVDLAVAQVTLERTLRNSSITASLIPDISIKGGVTWDDASIIDGTPGTIGSNAYIGISMDIGSDIITDASLKSLQKDGALLDYMLSAENVEQAVVTAYWNLALCEDSLESARLTLESASRTLDSIQERYDNGMADELELGTAQLDVLQYEGQVASYESQCRLAVIALCALTGIEDMDITTQDVPDIPDLELPDAETLMQRAQSGNLTIRSLHNDVDIARATSADAKATNQLPSITISAGYDLGPTMPVSSFDSYKTDRASVSVGFTIPISSWIPGSAGSNAVKDSQDGERIAKLELQAGYDDPYYSIEEGLATFEQSTRALQVARGGMELAGSTFDLVQERYENGYCTLDELDDARRELLEADLAQTRAEVDRVLALSGLSYDIGMDVESIMDTYSLEE